MLDSLEMEKRLCAMFDFFCKTVIRNYSRNLKRDAVNQKKHLTTVPSSAKYLQCYSIHKDAYPSEQNVFYVKKQPFIIENETLYLALKSLPENQRNVLLLDYWLKLTDKEIAKRLEVTRRTVYNWRNSAFSKIREYYEKHGRDP